MTVGAKVIAVILLVIAFVLIVNVAVSLSRVIASSFDRRVRVSGYEKILALLSLVLAVALGIAGVTVLCPEWFIGRN